jgi:hypothetical protein
MSSTSLSTLPPSLRSSPVVQRVMSQLTSARRSASEARAEAKNALSPAMATGCTIVGASGAGAIAAYLKPQHALPVSGAAGIGLVIAGAVSETPELVAIGNGMLAPIVADWVFRSLSARQPASPEPTRKDVSA